MLNFQKLIQYCIDEYYNSFSLLFKGDLNIDEYSERMSDYKSVSIKLKKLYNNKLIKYRQSK